MIEIEQVLQVIGVRVASGQVLVARKALFDQRENRAVVPQRMRHVRGLGEWRDRAYRVRKDLLKTWGGLSVNDGYIQRSAVPPS